MRIASTQYHATMNNALQTTSVAVENLMQQMASGQKLLLPSDDPITNVRLARLSREEAALDQYRANIGGLQSRLQQSESILSGMSQQMQQARDLLVWASDGSNTSGDLNAMAGTLSSLRDSLFYTSNTKNQEGLYIFSGTAVQSQTITDNGAGSSPRYVYGGDTGVQQVVVGNGVKQPGNVDLSGLENMLNLLDTAVTTLLKPGVSVNNPTDRVDVTNALNGLDVALDSVNNKVASIGGTENIMQTLDGNHANVSLSNKQAALTLGQLDYGDAAVKLNAYQTALLATQKAYAKVGSLSLFDVL